MGELYKYMDFGDCVYGDNTEFVLTDLIATGGEGAVFNTNSNYVCKIYKTEKLDKNKFKKIRLMKKQGVVKEGICWPREVAYDEYGNFRGYLMDKGLGEQMKQVIFNKRNFKLLYGNWRREDLVRLTITILEQILYLQDNKIILGDINQKNILVKSSKEVYLVDTDSYQIDKYTCPVGTILFTAPEIQGKKFSNIYRTLGNEYFSVATLIYMILFLGKTPYNYSNQAELLTNIRKGNFTLHLDNARYNTEVELGYRLIWSHLPFDIREAFYSTFKRGESRYYEENRISTREWHVLMVDYYDALKSGILLDKDSKANDIFPKPNYIK